MALTYKIEIYQLSEKPTVKDLKLDSDQLKITCESNTLTSILTVSMGDKSEQETSDSSTDQKSGSSTGQTSDSSDDKETFTLISIDYCKQIYEPGWVEVVLEISDNPTASKIKETFANCILDLTAGSNLIAQHYYIFQVKPVYKTVSSNTSCTVTLKAYSPDKFLTLDTYSRAYTCKRFFEDMVFTTLGTFKSKSSFTQFLRLTSQVNNNLKYLKVKDGCFILPYSVQYNESFYDFLVRLANRNGEFLYWDQGQLQVGLPSSSDSTKISDYAEVTYENPMFDVGDHVTPVRAIATDDSVTDYTVSSMLNPSEVANEEYWATLNKNGYDGFEAAAILPFIVSELVGILSEADLASMIGSLTVNLLFDSLESGAQINVNKSTWKDTYFPKVEAGSVEEKQYNADKNEYSPFSHFIEAGKVAEKVGKQFYATVQKMERTMDASCMQVSFKGYVPDISLGGVFYLNGDSTNKYVLIQMKGHVGYEEEKKEGETTSSSVFKDTLVLTGIPNNETSTNPHNEYPITSPKGWIRKSEPQTAFVVDNEDPLRMGRVRIKYLWQPNVGDTTDASPWIRMSTPMASKESGFFFLPSPGDEVMISFENGNVERPYMTGALHNKRKMPYDGSSNETITSLNGHQIAFNDGSPLSLISGSGIKVASTIGAIAKFFPQIASAMDELGKEGEGRKFAGGITLTDPYHFYTISMSTDERSVTIDSPLGSVELNAFTGINICAPNGNLYLQGKNIILEAGNKVEIRSGLNIHRGSKKDYFKEKFKEWGKLKLKEYILDLTFLRTVIESLLKPIDGTMRIASKRYLCLDAGEGESQVLDQGRFMDHWLANPGRLFIGMGNKNDYAMHIKNLDGCVKTCLTELAEKSNQIIKARDAYKTKWNDLKTTVTAFTEEKWKADIESIVTEGKKEKGKLPKLTDAATYFPKTNQNTNQKANNNANQNVSQTQQPAVTEAELEKLRKALFEVVAAVGDFEKDVKQQLKAKRLDEALYDKFKTGTLYAAKVAAFNVVDKTKTNDDFITAAEIKNKDVSVALRQEVIKATLGSLMKDFSLTYSATASSWDAIVDSVDYDSTTTTTTPKWKEILGYIGDFASESVGLNGFLDQYTWQEANKGEILFSNREDQTFYLTKDKTIDSYKGSSSILDDIKETLKTIK